MENQNNSNLPARKKRKTITYELLAIIRSQIAQGKTNKEISENNNISLTCTKTLANKISAGMSNINIINKREESHIITRS
jgi:DNA-binding NarL/FixJ family response regulator